MRVHHVCKTTKSTHWYPISTGKKQQWGPSAMTLLHVLLMKPQNFFRSSGLPSAGQSTSNVSWRNYTHYPYAQNIKNCIVCSWIANILKTFSPPRSPSGIFTKLSFWLYLLRHSLCVCVYVCVFSRDVWICVYMCVCSCVCVCMHMYAHGYGV